MRRRTARSERDEVLRRSHRARPLEELIEAGQLQEIAGLGGAIARRHRLPRRGYAVPRHQRSELYVDVRAAPPLCKAHGGRHRLEGKTCIIVRKGTEERIRALTDLAIARRAVSFPCTTAVHPPRERGNGRGERPPRLSEPTSRPTSLYAEPVMKVSDRRTEAAAEPYETNLVLAEVEKLIASAEERIEQQRRYVRTVATERSSKAIAKLEAMQSALAKLKRYRMRLLELEEN
jgi:hypothetical protein